MTAQYAIAIVFGNRLILCCRSIMIMSNRRCRHLRSERYASQSALPCARRGSAYGVVRTPKITAGLSLYEALLAIHGVACGVLDKRCNLSRVRLIDRVARALHFDGVAAGARRTS